MPYATNERIDCSGQALPINWEQRIRMEEGRRSRAFMLMHIARDIAKAPFLHTRWDVETARDLLLVAGEEELAARCLKEQA